MPAKPIEGLRELDRKIRELGSLEGGKVLKQAANLATTPVVKAARARIPVSDRESLATTYTGRKVAPGFAKRSIAKKTFLRRDRRSAIALVGVKPEAFYALQYVELGTSKQPKQPWLEPSFRETQDAQIAAFGAAVERKLLLIAKRKAG